MNSESLKIIEPYLKNLPEEIKEAILNNDIGSKLNAITKKHGLHIDQAASLEMETVMVMVGMVRSDEYIDNLMEELRISREKVAEIVTDVNTMIFADIKNSLQKMNEQIKKEDAEEKPKPEGMNKIETEEERNNLNKEDVLKDLEGHANTTDLVKTDSKIMEVSPIIETALPHTIDPAPLQSRVEISTAIVPPVVTPSPASEIKINPLENKLTEIVKSPKQEIQVSPSQQNTSSQKERPVDPYREPAE